MSYVFEPATTATATARDRLARGPAVILASVAAAGIYIDRLYSPSLDFWLITSATIAVAWFLIFGLSGFFRDDGQDFAVAQSRRNDGIVYYFSCMSAIFVLGGWLGLAGAWHHWCWNCRWETDIANSATDEPRLIRLSAKVAQAPWITRRQESELASWQNPERTTLIVDCRRLATDQGWMTVTGRARVSVDGSISTIGVGDIVEICGQLVLPSLPANPGEFNQREYLQSLGIGSIVRAESVEAIRVVSREWSLTDWLMILRGAARERAEVLISGSLGEDTAPVAQAMLLGTRAQIDEDTRRAFRESGLLHILAISGMNVGLLWSWLWWISRWIGLSAKTALWIVVITLPTYAIVTDANPPIVRATVVALIVALGQLMGRGGTAMNSLALAAIAVLIWNPSDLFNPGAQLSFLAVLAILHATHWLTMLHRQTSQQEADEPLIQPFLFPIVKRLLRGAWNATVVGLAVWTVTSPLVAREFHLVSPIGSLLTVVLAIPVTAVFWVGYSFLLIGLVWSNVVGWLGWLFDISLRSFLATVRSAAALSLGHFYVPAPPTWWIVGFYTLTILPLFLSPRQRLGTAISVRAGLLWMVFGLAWGICAPPTTGMTCTFISVGHGLGVLIEFPNGRTLLYDAGGMTGGNSVARTISQTVWETGRSRLDAIIVSHADRDHCNAIPELSRIVSPGGLFVHQSFLDWNQPDVASAIEQSALAGSRLRLISAGQELAIDSAVKLRVLHPPADFHARDDNPNSTVICVEYAGRRILLTGDLELDGLVQLLKATPMDVDVLLSPHHGSRKANPSDLARWATPEYLVVSTPDPKVEDRLRDNYGPETHILTTASYGAIRFRIDPDGELSVNTFKQLNRKRLNGAK